MINRIVRLAIALVFAACTSDRAPANDSAESRADSGRAGDSLSGVTPPESATTTGSPAVVPGRPACENPVTVTYYARGGVPDEFIVTFGGMNGAPADTLIDRLARKHGFTATHRYDGAFSGFSAKLTLTALEAMRCEKQVTRISQVVTGSIGTPPPTFH